MKKGLIKKFSLRGVGILWAAKGPKGICKIQFGGSEKELVRSLSKRTLWHVESRFCNHLPKGPLDLSCGTSFQQKVWRAIKKIPKGETRSYAWLAKMAGRPKAIRAAANACSANPIPILIPCHRVTRSDGTIGGFSGGIGIKLKLLAMEGIKNKGLK